LLLICILGKNAADDNAALFATRIFHKNVIEQKITANKAPIAKITTKIPPTAIDRTITTLHRRAATADNIRISGGQPHNVPTLVQRHNIAPNTLASSSIQEVSEILSDDEDMSDLELSLLPKEPKHKIGKNLSSFPPPSPPVYPT